MVLIYYLYHGDTRPCTEVGIAILIDFGLRYSLHDVDVDFLACFVFFRPLLLEGGELAHFGPALKIGDRTGVSGKNLEHVADL